MSGKPPRKGSNRKNVPAKSGGNPSTPAMSASGSTPSPKPAQWPEKAVTTAVAPSSSSSSSVAEDVTITPAGNRPAATNRRIFEAWKALPSHSPAHRNITRLIAYDGQNLCYSPKPMTSKSEEDLVWDVDLPSDDGGSRSQKFKVKFQSASEIEMVRLHEHLDGRLAEIPRDTFMALETILRYRPATLLPSKSTKSGGGSFFQVYKEDSAVNLYGGLSLQHGWYQATRATIQKMLMLNLDVSATTFYTPGMISCLDGLNY
ncbi:Eukaryotic translation initiation factor 2C [Nowakowskiella sp. JEL0407]|nr:Eukaryotic translation initiation factor 2C [Nowakowskiella sp. JEL0407]